MNGFYIFIGKDDSMGLVKNRVYCLALTGFDDGSLTAQMIKAPYKWYRNITTEHIWRCPYSSHKAFKANWEKVVQY